MWNSEHFFYFSYHLPITVIRVRIDMCWRGVPHDNALVYAATSDELESIKSSGRQWQPLSMRPNDDLRPIIAVVNVGGFLLSSGSGVGYGFAAVKSLESLLGR
jgi:hypothetical protein